VGKRISEVWDEAYDVVVIGSGFAGLAAAIEARKAGASVAVLEKRRVLGGNSMISGGIMAVAGSPLQKEQSVEDSPELMAADMLRAGLYLNHPDLVRMVAEGSSEAYRWTVEDLGVRYDGTLTWWGGHSVPRSLTTYNKSGSAIIHRQVARLEALGGHIQRQRLLTGLIRDDDGRVKGIACRHGYDARKGEGGRALHIKASKAVVLAAGGFGRDVAFRSAQDPRLDDRTDSTNHPGATSEALVEAIRIDANPLHLSWIQIGPWGCPEERGFGIAPWFIAPVTFIHGLVVDPATGRRFMNEMADRRIRADAVLNTGHPCVGIADSKAAAKARQDFFARMLKKGIVRAFDTLDELARHYEMPAKELKETVFEYNGYVAKRRDKAFEKPIADGVAATDTPPFYAVRIWPKIHHTMGGVQIDIMARVVDFQQKPIPGLYAAGEVAGGIHGASRLGSCAIADCLVFGRLAGQNAAAEIPWDI